MVQARRFKYFIIATVVCAVLLCAALFSVSFAAWSGGGSASAEVVEGETAPFYVEYPRYVEAPELENNTYYLQVPHQDNKKISDYYAMTLQNGEFGGTEQVVKSVYLQNGDTINIYKGTTKSDSSLGLTYDHISYSNGTYTVKKEGYFDFYYKYDADKKVYVDYTAPSSSSGDSGSSSSGPQRDTTYNSVKVNFTNNDSIVFQLDGAITPDTTTVYFYISGNSGQSKTPMPGLAMNKEADNSTNTVTLNCAYNQVDEIILTDGRGFDQGGKQTGTGNKFLNAVFGGKTNLVANCVYTITVKSGTHWDNFSNDNQAYASYFTATHSGSGSGGGSTVTYTQPTTTGATNISANNSNDITKVRHALMHSNGVYDSDKGGYVYRNYISVSRINAAGDDDNSLAYLEFALYDDDGTSALPDASKNAELVSFNLTRFNTNTDGSGKLSSGTAETPPRIYNYDPNADGGVKLGDIGPGFWHDDTQTITGDPIDRTKHMIEHFDTGMYAILYFGDNDQQYFALNVEIVTKTKVDDFALVANANNVNRWQRYEDGYGEPWGFYMGGLINSVKVWDPNNTTKLERASTNNITVFSESKETTALGKSIEDTSLADAKIEAFNNNSKFNYKIINYGIKDGKRSYARYPKGKIDVSLTVNLTENSRIKIYMLDNTGHRLDIEDDNGTITLKNRTVWVMPNEIKTDDGTDALFKDPKYDVYDEDGNIIIPQTGTYVLRLVGHFHTGDETVNGKSGYEFDYVTGERGPYEGNNAHGTLQEYNLIVDYLYLTRANGGNSAREVTLNGGDGGYFDNDTTKTQITRQVTFGSDISKLPKPTHATKTFAGWYYMNGEERIEVDSGAITKNMTLTARWDETHTITFNANGGKFAEDKETLEITTQNDGTISTADLPDSPVLDNTHEFLGWFTATTGGEEVDITKQFTANITLYAQWTQLFTVTFHNNYPDADTDSAFETRTDVRDGAILTAPTGTPERTGYRFDGKWYQDNTCTTEWIFTGDNATTVSATTKDLYAGWTIQNFTVSFKIDGVAGTGAYAAQAVQEGKTATQPANPSKDYYEFKCWNNSATANAWNFNSAVMGDIELVADWNVKNYAVNYDVGDGSNNAQNRTTTFTKFSSAVDLKAATPPTGHSFKEWQWEESDGNWVKVTQITSDMITLTTTTIELKAVYEKLSYEVKFDLNGLPNATVTPADQSVKYQETATEPTVSSLLEHYTFSGWYTNKDHTGNAYNFNTKVTGNITLYAYWYADNGVYLNNNYVKALTRNNDSSNGTEYMALDVNVAADNSVFTFWYDKVERTSTVKKDNTPYYQVGLKTGDIKLSNGMYNFYYKFGSTNNQDGLWIAPVYTVTFDLDGGTSAAIASQSVQKDGKATKPANPTRNDGFTFKHWYLSTDSAKAEYDFDTPVTGNITLKALWEDASAIKANHYYVFGTINGENHWGTTTNDYYIGETSGSVTIDFKSGDIFKVTKSNATGGPIWSGVNNGNGYDYYKLTSTNDSIEKDSGASTNIKIAVTGKYKISFSESGSFTVDCISTVGTAKTATIKDGNTVKATITVLSDNIADPYIWCWTDSTNYTGGVWPGRAFKDGVNIDISGYSGILKLITSNTSAANNKSADQKITFTSSYEGDSGYVDTLNGIKVYIKGMSLEAV